MTAAVLIDLLSEPASPPVSTSEVVRVAPAQWRRQSAQPPLRSIEGIERAERINEQLMRRSREEWQRLRGAQSPQALPTTESPLW